MNTTKEPEIISKTLLVPEFLDNMCHEQTKKNVDVIQIAKNLQFCNTIQFFRQITTKCVLYVYNSLFRYFAREGIYMNDILN